MSKNTKIVLLSGAALDKAIKSIGTRGAKLQWDIHVAACSALKLAIDHGNITPMVQLIDAVPAMGRKNALKAWAEAYGPYVVDGKEIRHAAKAEYNFDQAQAEPFYDFAPEAEYKPVDAAKLIAQAIQKLEKDQEKTGTDHSKTLIGLRAIV